SRSSFAVTTIDARGRRRSQARASLAHAVLITPHLSPDWHSEEPQVDERSPGVAETVDSPAWWDSRWSPSALVHLGGWLPRPSLRRLRRTRRRAPSAGTTSGPRDRSA